MNLNTSRHLRAFAIAAVPLFLIAGAAFASSGHPSVAVDPTSGPKAESTDIPGATGSPIVERTPDAARSPEVNESSEPTRAPDATDKNSAKDKDLGEGPAASATAMTGHVDNDGGKGRPEASNSPEPSRSPEPSNAPVRDGGFTGHDGGHS